MIGNLDEDYPINAVEVESQFIEDEEELHEDPGDCEDCPEITEKVSFDLQKWHELQHIKTLQNGQEFAVYLLGQFNEDSVPEITDYYIPEQEVSATAANITEDDLPPEIATQIIGHLHSHHSMGCSPSNIDTHHLNYPVHIIISNSGDSCTVRRKATCGRILKRPAEIELCYSVANIQGLEKIKPLTNTFIQQSWNNQPRRIWRNGRWIDAEPSYKNYHKYNKDSVNNSVKGSKEDLLNPYYGKEMTPEQKLPVGMQ